MRPPLFFSAPPPPPTLLIIIAQSLIRRGKNGTLFVLDVFRLCWYVTVIQLIAFDKKNCLWTGFNQFNFFFKKFSTWILRLPFAVNVTLNSLIFKQCIRRTLHLLLWMKLSIISFANHISSFLKTIYSVVFPFVSITFEKFTWNLKWWSIT